MSDDAHTGDEPVNIAPPQWQCPHCKHNYREDLAKATACAHAGPPAPAPTGAPVLLLPSYQDSSSMGVLSRESRGGPALARPTAGPVTAETVDGVLRHRRDVRVAGTVVDARTLADVAARSPGDLIVLVRQHGGRRYVPAHEHRQVTVESSSIVERLFGAGYSVTGNYGTGPVWIKSYSYASSEDSTWLLPPQGQDRDMIEMLTGGLLSSLADTDVDAFAAEIERQYRNTRYYARPTGRSVLASPAAALQIAAAHGAASEIWALRWVSMHAATIARWQAETAIAWAAGNGGPITIPSKLRVSDKLPNNPGKRRLAQMAAYDTEDYHRALDNVVKNLITEAPLAPVPGLGDVGSDLFPTRKDTSRAH